MKQIDLQKEIASLRLWAESVKASIPVIESILTSRTVTYDFPEYAQVYKAFLQIELSPAYSET